MNDSYAEWLVKRKAPAYNIIIKAALIILCAISAFLALTTVFGILILTAAGVATYFIFQQLNLEFEYLIVNDQITIDKIMGQKKESMGRRTQRNTDHSPHGFLCPEGLRESQHEGFGL